MLDFRPFMMFRSKRYVFLVPIIVAQFSLFRMFDKEFLFITVYKSSCRKVHAFLSKEREKSSVL